jgi:hypothetical protein
MKMPFGFVINALSAFFLLPVCYRLLRLSYWRATRSRLPVRSHPPARLLRMLEARSERTSAVACYRADRLPRFHRVRAPDKNALEQLFQQFGND